MHILRYFKVPSNDHSSILKPLFMFPFFSEKHTNMYVFFYPRTNTMLYGTFRGMFHISKHSDWKIWRIDRIINVSFLSTQKCHFIITLQKPHINCFRKKWCERLRAFPTLKLNFLIKCNICCLLHRISQNR